MRCVGHIGTVAASIVHLVFMALVSSAPAAADVVARPFLLPGWTPQPARRTPWTRWLNTFDFRRGAGDPDYYTGSGFKPHPDHSNDRSMAEGRFGFGAPLFRVRGKRTQMMYYMGRNCPSYQATVEMFVRSQPGLNIWNDGKAHHVFHLYGSRGAKLQGKPTVSLIKTRDNLLAFQCQGTTMCLPVAQLKAATWYHLAVSWDTKQP